MRRMIALVFTGAVLVSAVAAPVAGADPGSNNGKGPGNGQCTAGSQASPGLSLGANRKCQAKFEQ